MNREPLTDAQRALVRRFVLTDPRRGGRPPIGHRRRVDAVLRVPRAGSPWRDLPVALGPWRSAYGAFRRWTRRDVRRRLPAELAGGRDCPAYLIDSAVVRARQHAAGAERRLGPSPRPLPRRALDQDPRGDGRAGPSGRPAPDRRPGERLRAGAGPARRRVRRRDRRRRGLRQRPGGQPRRGAGQPGRDPAPLPLAGPGRAGGGSTASRTGRATGSSSASTA